MDKQKGQGKKQMSKKDTVTKAFMRENTVFADAFNYLIFNGKKVMPIGGAYSIDKYYRIRNGLPWFETEQPDEAIKEYVESGVWIMFEEYDEIM